MKSFAAEFSCKPRNDGGSVWIYPCSWQGVTFQVDVDYGGFGQFRHCMTFVSGPLNVSRFEFERLFGVGGDWDSINEENVETAVAAFADLCKRSISLLIRIAELARGAVGEED